MNWKLTFDTDYSDSNEPCLSLTQNICHKPIRRWYGPLAHKLYEMATALITSSNNISDHQFVVAKHTIQHFLIEASFYQQKCLNDYRILIDTSALKSAYKQEIQELLLYIRMTPNHPKLKNIYMFADCHLPWSDDIEASLNCLLNAKLIQKIKHLKYVFFDKNPYPHDHVFDHDSKSIRDFQLNDFKSCQQVIKSSPYFSY